MLGLGVGAGAWRRGARSRATKAASRTHAIAADRFLTGGASRYSFRGGDATTGESPSLSDTIADAGVRAVEADLLDQRRLDLDGDRVVSVEAVPSPRIGRRAGRGAP